MRVKKEGHKMAQRIDVRQIKEYIKPDAKTVVISSGDKKQKVSLAYQKTGYGHKRYFMCPNCSERVEFLYLVNGYWSCRKCSGVNPYKGIQNKTKGGYAEIAYRMQKYAFNHDIKFEFPFNYLKVACDNNWKDEKFRNDLWVLQALENMRSHSLFFKVTYKANVLKSVITGKHPLMQKVTLMELKDNTYDWNTGKQIIVDQATLMQITR